MPFSTPNRKPIQRPLFVFYLLVVYVLLQFAWWSYMLYDLNGEIYELRSALNSALPAEQQMREAQLEARLSQRRIMVLGEGMVFLVLLSLGILQTRRSFQRENKLAQRQKNFLLSVTHELKSPVAAVKLFLQTLGKRELEKARQQEIIHRAIEETNRLDRLIENILVAARLDNHVFQLNTETIALKPFLEELAAQVNSRYGAERLQTRFSEQLFLHGDTEALRSIVLNLIENAFKYGPDDAPVVLSLDKEGEKVLIQVADRGPGIPAAERSLIFEKFYRSGNEETRRTKGTGLGLYIVAVLTALHQGSIRVVTNPPQGCIFELRFKAISNA